MAIPAGLRNSAPPPRKWIGSRSVKSTAYGLGIAMTIYVIALLNGASPISAFFYQRGLVQPIILSLACCVLMYAVERLRVIRKEAGSLDKNWLLESGDLSNTANDALIESTKLLAQSKSLVANRQSRVLFAFLRSGSRDIARYVHQDDSYSTSADIENSYLILKACVWAMPMLGFLGTVLGISTAVSGFSGLLGNATQLDSVKQSLGAVTTGLSTAFDTTLLGIIGAVICMIALTLSEKSELRLAIKIDDKVTDTILSRLIKQ